MDSITKQRTYSLNNWRITFVLFCLVLFFTIYVFPDQQSKINELAGTDVISLDVRLKYSFGDVIILFDKLGLDGRDAYYFVSSTVDLIYPIVYGSFFTLLLSNLLKKVAVKTSRWRWLLLMPIIAVVFDYLENINIQRLLKNYPDITASQVAVANLMSQLKWSTLAGVLLIIGALSLMWLIKKIRR